MQKFFQFFFSVFSETNKVFFSFSTVFSLVFENIFEPVRFELKQLLKVKQLFAKAEMKRNIEWNFKFKNRTSSVHLQYVEIVH